MDFDTNPLDEERPLQTGNRVPNQQSTSSNGTQQIMARALRQKPYFSMIAQFQDLFFKLPELRQKEVDERLKGMYETLMEACESVGISRISIPQLKECCGRGRTQPAAVPAPSGLRLGDKVAWLLDKLGFKKCEACRKRQEALNKIRLPGS
jgi:hypothetical protein